MYSKDSHDFNISMFKMSPKILEEMHSGRFRVVIFGSARVRSDDIIYTEVFELARLVGEAGFDIVTGGGPGVMEAANLGHRVGTPGSDNKAMSIGLNIRLPMEQHNNPHLDLVENHDRFSTRLDEFMILSNIVVIAPAGGIGTLLEFFYTWQLIQVHHVKKMPIVLIGDMWQGLIDWIKKEPLAKNYLNQEDMDSVIIVKNCKEAFQIIKETNEKRLLDASCSNKKYSQQTAKVG